jgi:hypothetical protein
MSAETYEQYAKTIFYRTVKNTKFDSWAALFGGNMTTDHVASMIPNLVQQGYSIERAEIVKDFATE